MLKPRTRSLRTATWFAVLAGITLVGCGVPAEEDAWVPPALTGDGTDLPEGRDVVQRMIEFMSGHETLAMEAVVTYTAIQESGQKLHFDLLQRIAVRQPDRLFWATVFDDGTADSAWFSGGRFRLLRRPAGVWGQVRIPGGTISDMVDVLEQDYDIDVPARDLLKGNAGDLWLGEDVTSIWYVGEAWVDGQWTDHVAVRKPNVDFELWIRQDEPFPAAIAIVYKGTEGQPSYHARFRRWATSLPDPGALEFTVPENAEEIEMVPVVLP
jgi:hypothetical protein